MLLANCTVAERILTHFPGCAMLRRHQTPAPRMFEPLLAAATACGVSLDVATSKARLLAFWAVHVRYKVCMNLRTSQMAI